MTKQCSYCKQVKDASEFWVRRKGKPELASRCKKCTHEISRAWFKTERGKVAEKKATTNYRTNLRGQVIKHLGGKCKKCGYSDQRALQLDHINGGGSQLRKQKNSWSQFYREVLRGEHPHEIQILCANCNWIKKIENKEIKNAKT